MSLGAARARILLVEDEPSLAMALRDRLKAERYEVEAVAPTSSAAPDESGLGAARTVDLAAPEGERGRACRQAGGFSARPAPHRTELLLRSRPRGAQRGPPLPSPASPPRPPAGDTPDRAAQAGPCRPKQPGPSAASPPTSVTH
jgi:hypothetical protein